ncbi:MAG: hypothetical protein NTW21_28820 [Verrucomicrobia bacterium]|nr:hypothetical protein [Verrucomicrobiota bacterium]
MIAAGAILYSKSNYRKLQLTDRIYQELQHPEWSNRVLRAKEILPNLGSADHKMLYLVDVRRVSIPLNDAIRFYEKETDRLGFRECHVDPFPKAQEKFQWDWDQMKLEIPPGDDTVVISQNFTSDSTIRRHKPAEQ